MRIIKAVLKIAVLVSSVAVFSSPAFAANLGSFTANCDAAAAPIVTTPLTGNVGDTFTVTTAGTVSQCWPAKLDAKVSYTLTNGYSNNFSSFVSSGTVITVTLAAAGTSNVWVQHNANNAGTTFNVTINGAGPLSQTVSFTSSAPAAASVGGATYTPTASATSGLTVAIAVDASAAAVCSISGGVVSFVGTGTCVLDANQGGNGTYAAATQVQQSFAVSAASAAPIPTLSEWARIALALMLVLFGAARLVGQNRRHGSQV